MFKVLNYFVQSIIIYFLFIIGRIIGLNLSRKLFAIIFYSIGNKFRSKKILDKNLKIFSKEITEIEKKRIISNMWKNYGMTFIEYIYLNYFRKSNTHIKISGEENLKSVIDDNKPAIFVSGHFANFELMSMEISKKKINLATIYRPLNNIFLNPFMEYLRKKYICKNQIKKGIRGVKESIEFIKKKHCLALMIDQRVSEGEKINFFGKRAYTTTLPAQLSIKFNISIIPVFIQRIDDKNFNMEFLNEIKSNKFKDKLELTNHLNEVLEKMIIKNPDQWIWTHNRWK